MYFNSQGNEEMTFDAIVVGSGISGGWAAKELSEKGLKTLVLERGRDVKHPEYPTATKNVYDLPHRDRVPREEIERDFSKQNRTGYTIRESTKHWWVKDHEQPYEEIQRFDWMRGYHVGGRSIMWGRQSYRWGPQDFTANLEDGHGTDWPIRYQDMARWYDYVETFAGISGMKEGLPQLPDGQFLPPMDFNCPEKHLRESIAKHYTDRILTIGRTANLTIAHNGRGPCQFRNRCIRGCPYGGYFSSNAATLPAAYATGNVTLRPYSVVESILYDADKKRATGVRVIDAETMEVHEFTAKIIFLCASTLNSTLILMNSANELWPDGLGSSSGELGHNLMDHHFRAGATGEFDEWGDQYYKGRRANGIYIPRFRNLSKATTMSDFVRGYGYQGSGSREDWTGSVAELAVGKGLKEAFQTPGKWRIGLTGFGECLPYHENKVTLNREKKDKWGMPTLVFDCSFKENELSMRKDMMQQAAEMLEAAGAKNVSTYDQLGAPGLGIHEMGTARMGRDPKSSVLNKNNQVWDAPNVFVTDGASMASAACQNPSLTYMALTARAADYAVSELKKMNL